MATAIGTTTRAPSDPWNLDEASAGKHAARVDGLVEAIGSAGLRIVGTHSRLAFERNLFVAGGWSEREIAREVLEAGGWEHFVIDVVRRRDLSTPVWNSLVLERRGWLRIFVRAPEIQRRLRLLPARSLNEATLAEVRRDVRPLAGALMAAGLSDLRVDPGHYRGAVASLWLRGGRREAEAVGRLVRAHGLRIGDIGVGSVWREGVESYSSMWADVLRARRG